MLWLPGHRATLKLLSGTLSGHIGSNSRSRFWRLRHRSTRCLATTRPSESEFSWAVPSYPPDSREDRVPPIAGRNWLMNVTENGEIPRRGGQYLGISGYRNADLECAQPAVGPSWIRDSRVLLHAQLEDLTRADALRKGKGHQPRQIRRWARRQRNVGRVRNLVESARVGCKSVSAL